MTISSTTRTAGPFTGNGTTATFSFAFKVFQAADLHVTTLRASTGIQSTLVLNTNYSVALNPAQDTNPGGSITLTAGALAAGYTLSITSNVAILQQTELTNQGGFYPEVITDALDRLTILIQQMQVTLNALGARVCVATVPGTVYTAPGTVAAVFVNGVLQPPTVYGTAGPVITFNYSLDSGDVVNALCTSI